MEHIKSIKMKFITTLLVSILFVFHSCEAENNDFFGKWVIYKYVGGNISALSETDAKAYIDREFEFQSNYALINNIKFDDPKYEFRTEQALDYLFYNYKINKNHIGINDDEVEIVEVSSPTKIHYELFVVEDKLIINIDGVFFFLTRKTIKEEQIGQKFIYCSKGSFRGTVDLTGKETSIKIQYSFFSYPDELIIEDQLGNILLQTPMKSTSTIQEAIIDLTNNTDINSIIICVKNKNSNKMSRWRFSIDIE